VESAITFCPGLIPDGLVGFRTPYQPTDIKNITWSCIAFFSHSIIG
jgi:hypothetical protein